MGIKREDAAAMRFSLSGMTSLWRMATIPWEDGYQTIIIMIGDIIAMGGTSFVCASFSFVIATILVMGIKREDAVAMHFPSLGTTSLELVSAVVKF